MKSFRERLREMVNSLDHEPNQNEIDALQASLLRKGTYENVSQTIFQGRLDTSLGSSTTITESDIDDLLENLK